MTSAGANTAPHVPVLVDEVMAALAIQDGETLVDGTFGAGGYTSCHARQGGGTGDRLRSRPRRDRGKDGRSSRTRASH